MLKWAVHTPRQSYLPALEENAVSTSKLNNTNNDVTLQPNVPSSPPRRKLKRKSFDYYLSRRLHHWLEKENQITSTPLNSTIHQRASDYTLRQLDSLRDLSNTVLEGRSSLQQLSNVKTASVPYNNPANYAATLPTREVEYSPCGLVPGHILALRGLGVADSYFEKPRYLPPTDHINHSEIDDDEHSKININANKPNVNHREATSSLSSSKMGDQTLERMIDAILESTRKEKKSAKVVKQSHNHRAAAMSPTYTPAEDPANDLLVHEFWPQFEHRSHWQQYHIKKRRRSLPAKVTRKPTFSEREVCSPQSKCARLPETNVSPLHLRRQRVVRRKRKTCKSTKPQLADIVVVKESFERQVGEHATDSTSPDSGHNSCSELEENYSTLGSNCGSMSAGALQADNLLPLDAAKRRLSFSSRNVNRLF